MMMVKEFWIWFSQNYNLFGQEFENTNVIDEIDRRIAKLGDFSWEIGPGLKASYSLTISPGGRKDQLILTRDIISQAPVCPGWEFHYAKPPKRWDMIFFVKGATNQEVKIDARSWSYVLLKYEDGMFEILLEAPTFDQLGEVDAQEVSEILIEGIIGEEARIQFIATTHLSTVLDSEYQAKKGSIMNLSGQMKKLTTSH